MNNSLPKYKDFEERSRGHFCLVFNPKGQVVSIEAWFSSGVTEIESLPGLTTF